MEQDDLIQTFWLPPQWWDQFWPVLRKEGLDGWRVTDIAKRGVRVELHPVEFVRAKRDAEQIVYTGADRSDSDDTRPAISGHLRQSAEAALIRLQQPV
ncbi:MAG: hypothetical protein F4Z02_01370 [Acidimicrobiia bacterium]|nr:hypothetical protein [Acidimicrobiia bacterium]